MLKWFAVLFLGVLTICDAVLLAELDYFMFSIGCHHLK